MTDPVTLAILIGAGLLILSVFSSLISYRIGAPLLLVFLFIGLAAGEDGIGGIPFSNAPLAFHIGSLALAVILFDTGLGTRFQAFRVAAPPAVILATLGVVLTALLVAIPARYLLGLDWITAFLLGALVGSTDAAAVFFLLRTGGIQIRERVRATLEIESGSNDPMAIFLTIILIEMIAMPELTQNPAEAWGTLLMAFGSQMGLGLVLGLTAGFLMAAIINRLRLEAGLSPIAILGMALIVFSAVGLVGGSGFLAVYVAGLVMGNRPFRGGLEFRRFQDGLTWLAQITMFLVLGLLATPSSFPEILWQSVAIALFLIVFARPLAVWLCLLPFGFRRNESGFIAWVGLRGAVSILLAILPIMGQVEQAQLLFNAAFIIVLTSLLVQGWTIRPLARWLGLIVPPSIGPVDKVELELPGNVRHELIAYRIAPDSPVAQGERLPRWARPSLVIRDGRSMRIHEAGRLRVGDNVYMFSVPRFVPLLDRLFARPAALSEEDRIYFGDFALDPEKPILDLAEAYGLALHEDDRDRTVGGYLARHLGAPLARGDRLLLPPVELIVREVDEAGNCLAVGLATEPSPAESRHLPLFLNGREILAMLKRALKAWRERQRMKRGMKR